MPAETPMESSSPMEDLMFTKVQELIDAPNAANRMDDIEPTASTSMPPSSDIAGEGVTQAGDDDDHTFTPLTSDIANEGIVNGEGDDNRGQSVGPGLNKTGNGYFEVRVSPGKGLGCFALKPIERGTRVLAEKAMIMLENAEYTAKDVEAAFSSLSPEQKEVFFTLASNHGQDPKKWPKKIHCRIGKREWMRIEDQHKARIAKEASVMSIFQTNCMETRQGTGLYVHASRFNHCCNPNASFSFNAALGMETVHIMHDVAEGEEITFSYCDMSHAKVTRTWEIKHYGFECECRACKENEWDETTFAGQSRARRLRILELENETRSKRGMCLPLQEQDRTFVTKLVELAGLYMEEGNYSARLAGTYLDIVLVCEMQNDLEMAVKCAAKAELVKRLVQGTDHPEYKLFVDVKDRVDAKLAKLEAVKGNEVKMAMAKAHALLVKPTLQEIMTGTHY